MTDPPDPIKKPEVTPQAAPPGSLPSINEPVPIPSQLPEAQDLPAVDPAARKTEKDKPA